MCNFSHIFIQIIIFFIHTVSSLFSIDVVDVCMRQWGKEERERKEGREGGGRESERMNIR